jgi:small nuclear ribonucleoprotein (snRNP)-like protein
MFASSSSSSQVNLVLDDAIEYTPDPKAPRNSNRMVETRLHTEILLNGNQIAALVPGGSGPLTSA